MSSSFRPRLDVLPGPQKDLWPALRPLAELGFVLYGGTAVALRLGHRASVDFDFFSDRPLDRPALRGALSFLSEARVIQEAVNTWTFITLQNVKISFFGGISFGRLAEPQRTEDSVLWVASELDLLALKLSVILQRVEAKDYLDMAALLESGMRLEDGLAGARALYGDSFQPSESLKALVYFQGGDLSSLPTHVRKRLVESVKSVSALPKREVLSKALTVPSVC